jgi:restriction system protein
MAIPEFQSSMLPVLRFMADGRPHSVAEMREHIAAIMGIPAEDLKEMLPSGLKTRYEDRVNWSVTYLYFAKLIARCRRGVYRVTQRGQDLLAQNPQKVTVLQTNTSTQRKILLSRRSNRGIAGSTYSWKCPMIAFSERKKSLSLSLSVFFAKFKLEVSYKMLGGI